MGKIKEIIIDTINETEQLSTNELIVLLKQKNKQLNVKNEIFEFLTDEQLIGLITQKNLLIISNSIK